ncbi:MFS transporter [Clostridium tertium]|jgi:MFS family permease|uniref:MFS transporter n=1 Tax=Clostridium TaxID=1485 RepID=UPI0011571976|nr:MULTISPECIES: MFS transporter [Clostridium]MBS5306167.1 MFS transporter [Clostridium sp.]MBU6134872.1 MFS transporter [Clostridium tertium]MDB1931748.1 MFS transporter [Clostridium tertium]MDB1938206.1 MFS transporter [Clostridium tertium]MDB1940368.1 MFS transporter [Clostridium tertium]
MKLIKNKEDKNAILFYLGSLISIFGTAIYTFAISLYTLKITGSSISFSTTLILSILPIIILNPIVGVIADKFNKKKLVVTANLLNGVFLFIVYLISNWKGLSTGIIYLSTFVVTSINIIFDVSIDSAIPNIVSKEKIVNINAGNRIIDSISSVLGPVFGGIAFAIFNIESFILINSISFLVSAILDTLIDFKYNSNSELEEKSDENIAISKLNYFKEIAEGFKYLISKRYIIEILAIFIIFNFFISFSVTIPIPIILNNILKIPTKSFGLIQGAIPVGMIIGAFMVKNIIAKYKLNSIFSVTGIIISVNIILLSIPLFINTISNINIYVIYYLVIMIFMGVCISLVDIPFSYTLQTNIEEEFRARSLSLTISIVKVVVPISYLISGVLLQSIEAYVVVLFGGISVLIVSTIFYKCISKK